jgi:site-specific recombinase XerD
MLDENADPVAAGAVAGASRPIVAAVPSTVVPVIIADAGGHAVRHFREFFAATIQNENTRSAYLRAVGRFFLWSERHASGLDDVDAALVAAYIKALAKRVQQPTVKQHLAAIRSLFDWLVACKVVATNPAHAIRGPKDVVRNAKTTVLDAAQAREFIDSIDISSAVGLRDRALIGVMTFAFARIGAVVAMRLEDYYQEGGRSWVRLHEKGGKRHEMPAIYPVSGYLDAYIDAAGFHDGDKAPLFRTAAGTTGILTEKPMNPVDVWRMIQRRSARLGIKARIGCHTFRATGITTYLEAGGTIENAQAMAAHVNLRTTRLYDPYRARTMSE